MLSLLYHLPLLLLSTYCYITTTTGYPPQQQGYNGQQQQQQQQQYQPQQNQVQQNNGQQQQQGYPMQQGYQNPNQGQQQQQQQQQGYQGGKQQGGQGQQGAQMGTPYNQQQANQGSVKADEGCGGALCCCFSADPLDDDKHGGNSNEFQVTMCKAPCQDPLWFCFGCLCQPCSNCSLRKSVLNDDMTKYKCCQGYMDNSCCQAGKCHEQSCPACCLCLESTCCPALALSTTREYTICIAICIVVINYHCYRFY
jgi:hypothetical protein